MIKFDVPLYTIKHKHAQFNMDLQLSYYQAKSCGMLTVALDLLEASEEFAFSDSIEIQDILQKDETVFFTIPRNYVREWFLRKVQQLVNGYDDAWFAEQMK